MIDLSKYSIFEIYVYFFKNANSFNLNLYKGVVYITLHMLYGVLLIASLLLITNINYLFIILIIVFINCFSIYKFKRCPLAEIERCNINFSCVDYIFKYLYSFAKNNKSKSIKKPQKRKKGNKSNVCFTHLKYNNIDEVSLENLVGISICIMCKIIIIMLYECLILK